MIYKLAPYLKIREEKFGAVLFETLKEKVYVTNKCGRIILSLLREKKDLDKIILELTKKFKAKPGVIKRDTLVFIDKLKKEGLIKC